MGLPDPLPAPRCPRYWSLDVWRGFACLAVVVVHSCFYFKTESPGFAHVIRWILNRLSLGVPVFFVISGYCIAATADSTRRRGSTFQYFWKRLRRIFPPYWACLLLAVVGVELTAWAIGPGLFSDNKHPIPDNPPGPLTQVQWIGNVTLTETWRPRVFGSYQKLFLGQAWTLCYEEQFYVVCGLLLLAGRRFFAAAAVVTATCLLTAAALHSFDGLPFRGFFFDGRWLMFAAGIAVYYQHNYASRAAFRALAAVLLAGLAGAVLLRLSPGPASMPPVEKDEFIYAFGFALLLLGLRRWDRAMYDAPALRPVRFCGEMCYGLYLIHWPIAKAVSHAMFLGGFTGVASTLLLTVPLSVGLSVVAARVFYHCVERRFLNAQPAVGARSVSEGRSTLADASGPDTTAFRVPA